MKKTFIIAEAGVNHNGSLELAKRLCLAAKNAGADCVKFQTWKTENVITRSVAQADYQVANTGVEESQFDMLKKLELSYDDFRVVKAYCDEIGIQFASTADEPESLDFLLSLGIPFIKIGSGEIGNIPYLRYIGSKNKPVILSTGMSTLADVELSVAALRQGGATDITLLHCTTSYPCPYDRVNLRAMDTLRAAFDLPVGYSDHTEGIAIPTAAVARGAVVIEKHFTLDRHMDGPDHLASTEPEEFQQMIAAIRQVEAGLGNGHKTPSAEERTISAVVLKRIVAKTFISAGEELGAANLTVKRSDKGLAASYWDIVVGTKAQRNYAPDEAIEL